MNFFPVTQNTNAYFSFFHPPQFFPHADRQLVEFIALKEVSMLAISFQFNFID